MTNKRKYYDWHATLSRQTGSQGEVCLVIGAKNIGKTFGLRKQCINDFLKSGDKFCEICRTKDEKKIVAPGYFSKFEELETFKGYIFKSNSNEGYIAIEPPRDENGEYTEKPNWQQCCYFIALTMFQTEKKRTFSGIKRYIFDEAVIDNKDRYHSYLPNEYLILTNILDSISRQQPRGEQYRVYLLGNACDLTCPYLRHLGVNKIPRFGYNFYNKKHTLLHYVKPWDSEDMKAYTVAGRMLNGLDKESAMIYDNVFNVAETGDISEKSSSAKFAFALTYNNNKFSVWLDISEGLAYICARLPKDARPIYALTKQDATIDYIAVERSSDCLKLLNRFFYSGLLRYDTPTTRELFLAVLDYLGVR